MTTDTFTALAERFLLVTRTPTDGMSEERWQEAVLAGFDDVAADALHLVNTPTVRDRLGFPGCTQWAVAVLWMVSIHEKKMDPDTVRRLRSRSFTQLIDGSHADLCRVLAALLKEKAETPAANRGHDRTGLSPEEKQRANKAIREAVAALPEDATREMVIRLARELNGGSRGVNSTTVDAHPAWRHRLHSRQLPRVTTGNELTQATMGEVQDREAGTQPFERAEKAEMANKVRQAAVAVLVKNGMNEADAERQLQADPTAMIEVAKTLDPGLQARLRTNG